VNLRADYKFNYNAQGAIIPPQTMGTPFGFALAVSLYLLPVIPHLHFPREGLSPFFIQYLPSFWALRKAGLVSTSDLALFEIATLLYLLARAAYFPFFRRRHVSFFSKESPPPLEMSRLWPRQISGSFKVGALCMAASFVLGPLVYFENILGPKYAFCLLQVFAGAGMFLTEALMGLGLYSTFKSKFWHQTSRATDANGRGEE
jgi:hypothetical protein